MSTKNLIEDETDKYTSFLESLRPLKYAIFDFDGTIYPRLFLFDLTKKIFTESGNTKKLETLNVIAEAYAKGNFRLAYMNFLELLNGEEKANFQKYTRLMMSDTYTYAKYTIKKLDIKYGIKSYLVSLTADFIADIVKKEFKFEEIFAINYLSNKEGIIERFNGKTNRDIEDQQKMKKNMLADLIAIKPELAKGKYVCFFDSNDDIPIAINAALKVGINPKQELLKTIEFDLVLKNRDSDPWKELYERL